MNKFSFLLLSMIMATTCIGQKKALSLPIIFEAICKGENNILNKKLVNDFGENYSITKLKYYLSNVKFETGEKRKNINQVYLIDVSKKNLFSIKVPSKNIIGISFLLGIDSSLKDLMHHFVHRYNLNCYQCLIKKRCR